MFNILESLLTILLVNARHIKAVPGRKTDVRDCEWLADLFRHGLLKASFIPPPEIREVRELVRYWQTVVREHTAVANRITKLIESANLKLGQVASEVWGLSGRLMLRPLAEGELDVTKLAELAQGKLKRKKAERRRALEGRLTRVQRWVLAELLTRVEELEAALVRVEARIGEEVPVCTDPFVLQAVELLETIPGVGIRTAQTSVAEVGVDMERFPGQTSFKGQIHHTGLWPKKGVDLKGKRVAVVGIGATGIQVIQTIKSEVGSMTIFVRTPQDIIPMRNPKYTADDWARFGARFHELKKRVRGTFAGFDYDFDAGPWVDKTPEQRVAVLQRLWDDGSLALWLASFPEMFFDESVSYEVSEFVRRKMRERLKHDPELCDLLIPTDYGFGTHRVPLESGQNSGVLFSH